MTASVQELLKSFNALSERGMHEAAAELLRRVLRDAPPEIPEKAFVTIVDELFLEFDAHEASRIES